MDLDIKKIVKEVNELRKIRGVPFSKIRYRELKKQLTDYLLSNGLTKLKVGRYVLVIGYINKDRNMPYTQIFTKLGWEKHQSYLKGNIKYN